MVPREGIEPSVPNLTHPCEAIRTLAAFLGRFRLDLTAKPGNMLCVLCIRWSTPSFGPGASANRNRASQSA